MATYDFKIVDVKKEGDNLATVLNTHGAAGYAIVAFDPVHNRIIMQKSTP